MRSIMILFAATLMVNADVPSYIQVCKRNDPEIAKCIINSVNNLRQKLSTDGIPELSVPVLDPLSFNHLPINFGPDLHSEYKDIVMTGMSKYEIRDLAVDMNKNEFTLIVGLPEIVLKSTYNIDGTIANIPLRGHGPITIKATDVKCRAVLHGKRETRKGKDVIWFPSMDLKLDIGSYYVNMENLFDGDVALGKSTNRLLNESKDQILPAVIPTFEKAISETIITIANKIFKQFTFDELFPQ